MRVPWPLTWAVLQLGWWPGWLLESLERPWRPLIFSPAQLRVSEGTDATFTCSFSNWSEHLVLNWYRLDPNNQTMKLAAFLNGHSQPGPDPRFQVSQLPSRQDFRMSILAVRRNDSGVYLCGAISLPPKAHIKESPGAELTVTERVAEPPTLHPSPAPGPGGQFQGLVVGVTSVLVGVPVLLLLAWVLAAIYSRNMPKARRTESQEQPLADHSAVPVFTVAYGELDFQWREKTPEPPASASCVHTEYATVVFPAGPGDSAHHRRSADGPQDPQPLRHEEGHCSWPL
ncbi:programmed cell death protein 1 isoform X2 [Perognathus longimembris pacificus]|uniref:programmed cell death protein 1 isoform X2 n=1 Tax=Perognathus longimembris pacificus TaxID=214514 RepID=UPI002019787E|nr:programmed cell death protein 1 isoform X2 [Perognathus longimembris pacificus]